MHGMGLWIHVVKSCFGGDVGRIVDFCTDLGVTRLTTKHYDWRWHPRNLRNPELPELAQACMERGIELYVFEFNQVTDRGAVWNASYSAELAHRVNAFGLTLNVEVGWDKAYQYAKDYGAQLKTAWAGPVSLSTYRYPSTHPETPIKEILPFVDYVEPQLYYVGEQEAAPPRLLSRSMQEYKALTNVPVIPTWPTYQDGWVPNVASVKKALELSVSLPASSFWFMDWLHKHPDYVEVIKQNNPWKNAAPPPPPQPELSMAEKVDKLYKYAKDIEHWQI